LLLVFLEIGLSKDRALESEERSRRKSARRRLDAGPIAAAPATATTPWLTFRKA
jgi:hypothetical protein